MAVLKYSPPTLALAALAVLTLGLAACEEEPHPGWSQPLTPEGPYEMEDAVVYLDRGFNDLLVLRSDIDDGDPDVAVERIDIGAESGEPSISADGERLYLVDRGELPGDESLNIYDVDDTSVEHSRLEISGHFYDQITVDPEGDFLLLSYTGQQEAVAQPLNELGIIDFRSGEPQFRTATLGGIRVQDPEFLPSFELDDDQQERLAMVTATNWLALVDLNAEEGQVPDRRIPLTTSESDEIEPQQVVFQPPQHGDEDGGRTSNASLFIIDDRGDDITQVIIEPSLSDEGHRFDPWINQLAAGNRPQALEVIELEGAGQRLVVLDGQTGQFTLVDVASGESATFSLSMSQSPTGMIAYDRIDEEGTKPRILVYSTTSPVVEIIRPEVISIGGDSPSLGESIRQIRLEATPSEIMVDDDTNRAIVMHSGGNDGFSLINLDQKRDFAWLGTNFSEVVFDDRTGTAFGLFRGSSHIAQLDPLAETTRTFSIPDTPERLYVAPGGETVLVQHPGESGRFTAIPQTAFDEPQGGLFDDALLFEQVFLHDLLERPATDDDQ